MSLSPRFSAYSEEASIPDRDLFERLSKTTKPADDKELMRKRPREGVSFGIVPNRIINKVAFQRHSNPT